MLVPVSDIYGEEKKGEIKRGRQSQEVEGTAMVRRLTSIENLPRAMQLRPTIFKLIPFNPYQNPDEDTFIMTKLKFRKIK